MIYLIALNSSSIEDQAGIIPDRVECLYDLSEPILSSSGIKINDTLKFFTGDHPAQQFERGTQMGGTFKCGGCGCKETLMDDQAHALRCQTRQLHELQSLALGGVLGHEACVVKPLYVPDLPVSDIRKELRARGHFTNLHENRDVLQAELQDILQGVQRVPSLLLLKPNQAISEINLTNYHILDCEPMHDLKGHLLNLFQELPAILPPSVKNECSECIDKCLKKEKKSAAVCRSTLIKVFIIVHNAKDINWKVCVLLQSMIRVSEVMYAFDKERCAKLLLQLYNNAWLHHQLCYDLFQSPKLSRNTLFGLYIHSLSKHAAEQYELLCLRSINAENQERMFGQCRRIAENTTNRHPDNVIQQLMLRMQAKQNDSKRKPQNEETIVSKAALNLPHCDGTVIPHEFATKYADSWQAHLEKISHFLVCGKNIWWIVDERGYVFKDGFSDPPYHPEGPHLLHFRNSSIKEVHDRQKQCWIKLMEEKIEVPASSIKIYSHTGDCIGTVESSCTTQDIFLNEEVQCVAPQEHIAGDNECSVGAIPFTLAEPGDEASRMKHKKVIIEDEDQIVNTMDAITCTVETKLSKAIIKCTGETKEVKEFDQLRKLLKAKKHAPYDTNVQKYKILQKEIKITVAKSLRFYTNELFDFEKHFYIKHGHTPSTNDNCEAWTALVQKKKYAMKLIQTWKDDM